MAHYRFYAMQGKTITRADDVACVDDTDACRRAVGRFAQISLDCDAIEVWQRARFVRRLDRPNA